MSELPDLYRQMSDLTRPKCGECRAPLSCCDPMYCELAEANVAEAGAAEEVQKTPHPRLQYMGTSGCVVPPHLRPLCTLHVCSINGLGFDPKDPDFTKKYFGIRNKIEESEWTR
jgi:hypothetical protein